MERAARFAGRRTSGIAGYLLGPLVGGGITQAASFAALGLLPLAAAVPVLLLTGLEARRR